MFHSAESCTGRYRTMDRELIRGYLKRSMFTDVQAEALSRFFADMTSRFATKDDLADLKVDLSAMEARMTWRIIGAMAFLAALMTVLDAFID